MARGHKDLPARADPVIIDKRELFEALQRLDNDPAATDRILRMDTGFRRRVDSHIDGSVASGSRFARFNTNPFVLLLYAKQMQYSHVSEIEKDIAPAKIFSSMETAAGKIIEEVTLPIFGWNRVSSEMHTTQSIIDGERLSMEGTKYDAVTLKSGPRCLNDEMAKDMGTDIAGNVADWALRARAKQIVFTYGVLYGTKKLSNKKDWHVIRSLAENLPKHAKITSSHSGKWGMDFELSTVRVSAEVRIGRDWWSYLGGSEWTFLEICVALIRACVVVRPSIQTKAPYMITDLQAIIDTSCVPDTYNVKVLQRSQYEWLLFAARHFCDGFRDEVPSTAKTRTIRQKKPRCDSVGKRASLSSDPS